MQIPWRCASPPPPATSERDLRLDLFRGVALWLIFLDHIPQNIVNWFTIRNYGFSDATEIFIFISGYTAAFVYGRTMRERGFVLASARILRRAWQIYVAHIFLFTIFMAEIAYVAATFDNPLYAEEMNILDFLKQPDVTIFQALLLKFKPVNMDVLPLYIVLLLLFPPMLLAAAAPADLGARPARRCSTLLAWKFDWNLPAYPNGVWFFNPFAWQLLFVFGAWCALGGAQRLGVRAALARRAGARDRLSAVCLRHHADLAFRAARSFRARLAERLDVSDRQDQSRRAALRAFPGAGGGHRAFRPARLAGAEIADLCSRRSAAASIRWKSSASACFWPLPANSSSRILRRAACCRRSSAVLGILIMIATASLISWYKPIEGRSPSVADQTAGRRPRGRRGMKLIIALVATIALLCARRWRRRKPRRGCDVPESLLASDIDLTRVADAIKDTSSAGHHRASAPAPRRWPVPTARILPIRRGLRRRSSERLARQRDQSHGAYSTAADHRRHGRRSWTRFWPTTIRLW